MRQREVTRRSFVAATAGAAFGAMVETPAAALAIPTLAGYVEYFSVGTNDLTQYTLAASRDDASVNDYYLDSN